MDSNENKYKRYRKDRYNSSNACFLNSLLNTCMHVLGPEVTRTGRPFNTKKVLLNTKETDTNHREVIYKKPQVNLG